MTTFISAFLDRRRRSVRNALPPTVPCIDVARLEDRIVFNASPLAGMLMPAEVDQLVEPEQTDSAGSDSVSNPSLLMPVLASPIVEVSVDEVFAVNRSLDFSGERGDHLEV